MTARAGCAGRIRARARTTRSSGTPPRVGARARAPSSQRVAWLRSIVLPLGLSLLCLRSIFHPGYLLQVDIVFGPRPARVGHDVSTPAAALQADLPKTHGIGLFYCFAIN